MTDNLTKLEIMLGYTFNNKDILKTALTHSTYANEANSRGNMGIESNERLEFFGDSILSFIISELIIEKQYSLKEGKMSKLRASIICEKTLADCARELNLSKHIRVGGGKKTLTAYKDSVLADTFEAIIAAIYIDGGIGQARKFIIKTLGGYVLKGEAIIMDSKSILQELIQKKPGNTIAYELVSVEGPEHSKTFTVNLIINNKNKVTGFGSSIKEAEQQAAKQYLGSTSREDFSCI